jgi:hypothetical protein
MLRRVDITNRRSQPDRRVLRLDELPDSDLEDMLRFEIPAEYKYCPADIPD